MGTLRRTRLFRFTAGAAAALWLATSAPAGQIASSWVGGAAGDWNVAANWSPVMVPDNTVTDTFMVTINAGAVVTISAGAFTVDGLTVGAGDTLQLAAGASLDLASGPFTNDGLVMVNHNVMIMPTSINFLASITLDGSGTLHLNRGGINAEMTTGPGAIVTNSVTHEIRGLGNLQAALDNFGVVIADGGQLLLMGEPKRNNGIFTNAGVGSNISLDTVTVDQNPIVLGQSRNAGLVGAIIIDAAFSTFVTSNVCGGDVQGINGGSAASQTFDPLIPTIFKDALLDVILDISGSGADIDMILDAVQLLQEVSMFFGTLGTANTIEFQGGAMDLILSTVEAQAPTDFTGVGSVNCRNTSFMSPGGHPFTFGPGVDFNFLGTTLSGTNIIKTPVFLNGNNVSAMDGAMVDITQPVSGSGMWYSFDAGTTVSVQGTSFQAGDCDFGTGTTVVCSGSDVTMGNVVTDAAMSFSGDTVNVLGVTMWTNATWASDAAPTTITITDLFTFQSTDESSFGLDPSTLMRMTGGAGIDPLLFEWSQHGKPLEVGGTDLGTDPATHTGDPAGFVGNFHIDQLEIGPDGHIHLVDDIDNGNRNGVGGAAEALYVDILSFANANARLNLNGYHFYYNKLAQGDPSQIVDEPVGAPCPEDVDGSDAVNVTDLLILLANWGPNPGHPADIDGDGSVGVADLLALLAAWGPCP